MGPFSVSCLGPLWSVRKADSPEPEPLAMGQSSMCAAKSVAQLRKYSDNFRAGDSGALSVVPETVAE
jgi:hypothetical protein